MSIKGISGSNFAAIEHTKRKKKADNVKFDETMQKAGKAKEAVSAEIGKGPRPVAAGYSASGSLAVKRTAAKSSPKVQAEAIAKQIVAEPEVPKARVDEIKQIIANGGVESYFQSVDSEKVAERLLNSGILDDIV